MNPLRGILYKLLSVVAFVGMASLVKATADSVPPGQAVFFRSFFALPVLFAWLAIRGELATGWRTKNPMAHVWRGLAGTMGMGLGFTGLGLLPLPEVTAIGYATPLLVVVFAAMFLGEEVRAFRLTAVVVGLVGVIIILSPRLSVGLASNPTETLGALVVLMGAVMAALAHVFVRKMTATEATAAIVFWFTITSSVMGLLTLPWGWAWPSATVALMLVCCGVLGGIGQILMTSSYRYAPASVVAPFDYASMLLALIVGFFIFGEVPTLPMLGGASLVILAGVLIIWRERQLGLARDKQRRAMGHTGGK